MKPYVRYFLPIAFLLSLIAHERVDANLSPAGLRDTAVVPESETHRGITIEREQLDIDLRTLATEPSSDDVERSDFGTALVTANYLVRVDGAPRTMMFEFIAQSIDPAQWSVVVDGKRIAGRYRVDASLPNSYLSPDSTPGLDGDPIAYVVEAPGVVLFDAMLEPGRHTIRVDYVADVTRSSTGHQLVHWQLAYNLSPARAWGSFGDLEVAITLPPRWSAETSPLLSRNGDRLTGTFAAIPADAIAITARAPYQWWYAILEWLPSCIVLSIGSLAAYRAGRKLGRRLVRSGRSGGWALPAAFSAGFVVALASIAAGYGGALIVEALIGAGQEAWGDYTFYVLQTVFATMALVSGSACAQVGALRSLRSARRRYDARWTEAYGDGDERSTADSAGGQGFPALRRH